MLHDCIASLRDQVNGIIVVANNGYTGEDLPESVAVAHDRDPDRNISRWWNLGLEHATPLRVKSWNVLIVNDDVVMHPGSVAVLASGLREHDAGLAFPGPETRDVRERDRITGWCFMLRGEDGLRADTGMRWWYGDNDLDWRARDLGPVVMVSGVDHIHRDPNGYTNRCPDLAEQAGRDREVFQAKWGMLPH